MRALKTVFAVTVLLFLVAAAANTQQKQISDSEYIAQVLSAAPEAVAKGAAVVRMEKNGSMRTLRTGDNGFTCMMMRTDGKGKGQCNDTVTMEFMNDWMKHVPPPDKVGISYMLDGDNGASNTDPYAQAAVHGTGKTADNHWIVTGPHIMVVGPPSKTLGLTRAQGPDPNKPYMMWAGTPYEHAMIPVAPAK